MPPINKRLGVGAVVSVKGRSLEPKQPLVNKFGDSYKSTDVENLHVTRHEIKDGHTLVFMLHDDFQGVTFSASAGAVKLIRPGPETGFFAAVAPQGANGSSVCCDNCLGWPVVYSVLSAPYLLIGYSPRGAYAFVR
jgi:hypothetical protein